MAKKIVLILIKSQADFCFFHHFPHVNEGISHSAKGCIYAYIGDIGYFLKAQSRIMAKDDYFPLVIRQLANKFPDIFLDLSFNHLIFNVCICKFP